MLKLILDYSKSHDKCIMTLIFGLFFIVVSSRESVFSLYSILVLAFNLIIIGAFILGIKVYKSNLPREQLEDFYFKLRILFLVYRDLCFIFLNINEQELGSSFLFNYFFVTFLANRLFFIDFIWSCKFFVIESILLLPLFGNFESYIIVRIVSFII